MFIQPVEFIKHFIQQLSQEYQARGLKLSNLQQRWLSFCLMGILCSNQLCWAAIERISFGGYSMAALSWMFRQADIDFEVLFTSSIALVLRLAKITSGVLDLDDSDHRRAKQTSKIYGAHKVYDKKTGGYFNGQCLVFIVLVTDKFTIPVGFAFYRPDPRMQKWQAEDVRLKKAGIKKAERPKRPEPDKDYPSKIQIGLNLIERFHAAFPNIKIKGINADAAFGTQCFMDEAVEKSGCKQVVSQIKANQKVHLAGKKSVSVSDYFARQSGNCVTLKVRGGKSQKMTINSARLVVDAHNKKRFVIALKYEGETEYRYLVATDLTWRTEDIVQCYTLRWLVEVFFEDWKLCEGWTNLAKHPGEEGSCKGVILSLLFDHALLTHPEQLACIENRAPALTVGSLQQAAKAESFIQSIQIALSASNPEEWLEKLKAQISDLFKPAQSKKHMSGRDLGRLEPTQSLQGYMNSRARCVEMAG